MPSTEQLRKDFVDQFEKARVELKNLEYMFRYYSYEESHKALSLLIRELDDLETDMYRIDD